MINMTALKAKLDKFNRVNTGASRSESLWRPTEGKHTIRIVPLKDNPENPFVELYFHYLGKKTILSPISYGRRDPISEFADQIQASGDPKETYAQAKPYKPKLRTYVPIIVRGEEDKGVRFFSFGKTVYKDLLGFIDLIGDITDPNTGRDIIITYIPQEKSDTNFAKTDALYHPNQAPLSKDAALIKKWLTEQPDLKALYDEPTYQQLKVELATFLDPNAEMASSSDSLPAESPSKTISEAAPEATKTTVEAVLDEFSDLFEATPVAK